MAWPVSLNVECICLLAAGIFLFFVGGTAAIFGFSRTLMTSRKQDQQLYEQGTVEAAKLLEGGTRLAARALAWGTLYAFLGTGTFCYGVWKLSGATNVRFSRRMILNDVAPINKLNFCPLFSDDGIPPENGFDFAAHFKGYTANQPHRIRRPHRFDGICVDVGQRLELRL